MDVMRPPSKDSLDMPQQSLRPRASGITLWRPEIVLAETMTPGAGRPRVLIAEPALRPEAVKAQIEATGRRLARWPRRAGSSPPGPPRRRPVRWRWTPIVSGWRP